MNWIIYLLIRATRLREPSAEELFLELVQGTNKKVVTRLREPEHEEFSFELV